jgi:hypothetical protein
MGMVETVEAVRVLPQSAVSLPSAANLGRPDVSTM